MFYILKRRGLAGWLVCEVYYHDSQVRSFGVRVTAEEVLETLRDRYPHERFQLIFTEEDM